MDFVREVYLKNQLTLPPLSLNLTPEELLNPPIGHILYLRHKQASPGRNFTHAALILPERKAIHASYYFGMCVVITDLDELMKIYDLPR